MKWPSSYLLPIVALLLLTCFGSCTSTNLQTREDLYENFHHGIPLDEVMARTGASDTTDLLCYKGGFILNKEGIKTNIPVLTPYNALALGYGKIRRDGSSVATIQLAPDKRNSKILHTAMNFRTKIYMAKFQKDLHKHILRRADTLLDVGYRDRIIAPAEVEAVRKEVIKDSQQDRFPMQVDLPEDQ